MKYELIEFMNGKFALRRKKTIMEEWEYKSKNEDYWYPDKYIWKYCVFNSEQEVVEASKNYVGFKIKRRIKLD